MKSPLTHTGAVRLREELDRLKSTDRPRVIEAIAEARAHGDLKENAEYHAARSEEHTSELQSLMRISYAVFCLKHKKNIQTAQRTQYNSKRLSFPIPTNNHPRNKKS